MFMAGSMIASDWAMTSGGMLPMMAPWMAPHGLDADRRVERRA